MRMRFVAQEIEGAFLVELEPVADARGSFARTFCAREFAASGLEAVFVQHSRSLTRDKGVLRGMHYQTAPHEEVKLVSCVRGAIYDVCLDLRTTSKTFGRWIGRELSAENGLQLYIPKGCAHGFQALSDDAEVQYLISQYYVPEAGAGVRWNDDRFAIKWPLPVTAMSDKDRAWPDYGAGASP
jgi:dTDP-4-dehydrorhamnose 3,5-epimerase